MTSEIGTLDAVIALSEASLNQSLHRRFCNGDRFDRSWQHLRLFEGAYSIDGWPSVQAVSMDTAGQTDKMKLRIRLQSGPGRQARFVHGYEGKETVSTFESLDFVVTARLATERHTSATLGQRRFLPPTWQLDGHRGDVMLFVLRPEADRLDKLTDLESWLFTYDADDTLFYGVTQGGVTHERLAPSALSPVASPQLVFLMAQYLAHAQLIEHPMVIGGTLLGNEAADWSPVDAGCSTIPSQLHGVNSFQIHLRIRPGAASSMDAAFIQSLIPADAPSDVHGVFVLSPELTRQRLIEPVLSAVSQALGLQETWTSSAPTAYQLQHRSLRSDHLSEGKVHDVFFKLYSRVAHALALTAELRNSSESTRANRGIELSFTMNSHALAEVVRTPPEKVEATYTSALNDVTFDVILQPTRGGGIGVSMMEPVDPKPPKVHHEVADSAKALDDAMAFLELKTMENLLSEVVTKLAKPVQIDTSKLTEQLKRQSVPLRDHLLLPHGQRFFFKNLWLSPSGALHTELRLRSYRRN